MSDETPRVLRLTTAELAQLGEYSMSMPTGVFIGKQWKRNIALNFRGLKPHWVVGEFYEVDDKAKAGIRWYDVELTDGGATAAADEDASSVLGDGAATEYLIHWVRRRAVACEEREPHNAANLRTCADRLHALYFGEPVADALAPVVVAEEITERALTAFIAAVGTQGEMTPLSRRLYMPAMREALLAAVSNGVAP